MNNDIQNTKKKKYCAYLLKGFLRETEDLSYAIYLCILIFNKNHIDQFYEKFGLDLILYLQTAFVVFLSYLVEPPPQDYIINAQIMS